MDHVLDEFGIIRGDSCQFDHGIVLNFHQKILGGGASNWNYILSMAKK